MTGWKKLVKVTCDESDQELCKTTIQKLSDDDSLLRVAEHIFDDHYLCSLAINRINNQQMLFRIAQDHLYSECRIVAVKRLDDQAFMLEIAKQNSNPEVRIAAIESLSDQHELVGIACQDSSSWVRRAAIAKLANPQLLAGVAVHNNMRNIRMAALFRLQEIGQSAPLSPEIVAELLVLLNDSATVGPVIELAQQAGIDWASQGTDVTVQALFEAFSEGKGWQANVMMEHAVKRLYALRSDLRGVLLSYPWANPYTNDVILLS